MVSHPACKHLEAVTPTPQKKKNEQIGNQQLFLDIIEVTRQIAAVKIGDT